MLKNSTNKPDRSKVNFLLDVAEKIVQPNPDDSTPSINSKRIKISNAPKDLISKELKESELMQAKQTIENLEMSKKQLEEALKAEKNHNNIYRKVIKVIELERNNLEDQLKAEQMTLMALRVDFDSLASDNVECMQKLDFLYTSQQQMARVNLELQSKSSQNELAQQKLNVQTQALQSKLNMTRVQNTLSSHTLGMPSLLPQTAPILFQSYSGVFLTTRQSGFQTNSSFKPSNRSL